LRQAVVNQRKLERLVQTFRDGSLFDSVPSPARAPAYLNRKSNLNP
jgi:hypothetical protein